MKAFGDVQQLLEAHLTSSDEATYTITINKKEIYLKAALAAAWGKVMVKNWARTVCLP